MCSVNEGFHILLHYGVQEQLGNHGVSVGLEGEGDGEVNQTGLGVITMGWVKFPNSLEVVKYLDVSTGGGYQERFHKSDMAGVGEVKEGLESNHKVS